MSDRTPEQVAYKAFRGILADAIAALRAEGMLVEEGEVKVRLDGLEERLRRYIKANCRFYGDPVPSHLEELSAVIVRRVVLGETQEADRG